MIPSTLDVTSNGQHLSSAVLPNLINKLQCVYKFSTKGKFSCYHRKAADLMARMTGSDIISCEVLRDTNLDSY